MRRRRRGRAAEQPPEGASLDLGGHSAGVHRYFFQEAKWFEIGATHLVAIRSQVENLLSKGSSISLPRWEHRYTREDQYNEDAIDHGFILLD
jgi:uncharacterized protein (TIGR04141 family)